MNKLQEKLIKGKNTKKFLDGEFTLRTTVIVLVVTVMVMSIATYFINDQLTWRHRTNSILLARIDNFEQRIKKSPNQPSNYVELGYAYFLAGRLNSAISDYQKAIEIDKKYYPAYLNLAAAYYESDKKENSLEMATKAFKLAPKDYKSLLIQGKCYADLKHYKRAEISLKKVLEMSPANIDAAYELGIISEKQGNKKEAIDYYKLASSFDPYNKEIQGALKRAQRL
ncbi:MAG: hypothetical protein K0R71_1997 [Bacillales bacterium]|jgi:superkiller protein 3|nr:hypothetical protein [Bacillales bacterium]